MTKIKSAVRLNARDFKSKYSERFDNAVAKVGALCLVWAEDKMRYIVSGYDNKKPSLENCGIAYGLNTGNLADDYIFKNKEDYSN